MRHAAGQVYETENTFLIHHANAFEEGDETVVWSSGWVRLLGRC
jgi:carotenoid cleavage dioxygenase-like enzyme